MRHACRIADSLLEVPPERCCAGKSPSTESREASQVQVIGYAVDELNGDLPVLMGGQHLGGQRELGVNPQCLLAELDDEREPSRLDGHLGLGWVLEQFRGHRDLVLPPMKLGADGLERRVVHGTLEPPLIQLFSPGHRLASSPVRVSSLPRSGQFSVRAACRWPGRQSLRHYW